MARHARDAGCGRYWQDFDILRTAKTDRGRVETEILRDHAVSAARKRMGERRPRYARVLDVVEFVAGFSIVALQMRWDPILWGVSRRR